MMYPSVKSLWAQRGVRRYLENFFVGYHAATKLLSVELLDDRHAEAHLDFAGDFGHETGGLSVTVNGTLLIVSIDAYIDDL
jgi:hypothetical protein